ncbi:uncharacterized protein C22orf15 homolog [Nothoprocta perdicaria]|uniref:uncharacterized protein C22orf15 homolog n=1 Tax=Nothoprocta perdicaria TaxID=30464 RepID=UPI000E1BE8FC|nr:uncharacterized protein C22orf15 homolog [Nothoprocta perdicaria]
MFALVRYGADCQAMVNLHCRLLILVAHLKRKCQCRPEDNIDLLDESGALMNLSKAENSASELASKYLRERQRYILIKVTRKEDTESTCYESLLENLGKHYPELAALLQKLSASPQLREQWQRGPTQRRAQSHSTPARPRATPQRRSSELRGAPR